MRSGVEGKLAVGVLESVAGRIGVGKDVLGRRCVVAGCVAIKVISSLVAPATFPDILFLDASASTRSPYTLLHDVSSCMRRDSVASLSWSRVARTAHDAC